MGGIEMRRLTTFLLTVALLAALAVPVAAQAPTEELLSGMVTEEVEPGVYRVVNDGVRDLTALLTVLMPKESPGIVAGDDGSLWVQGGTRVSTAFPLGGELVELPPGTEGPHFVTSDGTVWAGLHTYDGEGWTKRPGSPTNPEWDDPYYLDGTVWGVWPEPPLERKDGHEDTARRWTVARFDGDEWRPLEEPLVLPVAASVDLLASEDGDIVAEIWTETGSARSRWSDGAWVTDESGTARRLDDHVAPDGSLWETYDPDWDWEGEPCLNVVRFDGVREDVFLADACADSITIGPDGAVWALARTGPDDDLRWDLYVITPEVAIATERPAASTRTDILPDTTLTVMEAEPGVFRVLHDGVRDPSSRDGDLVVGDDESIWIVRQEDFVRLGHPTEPWQEAPQGSEIWAFDVARDGTVWVLDGQPAEGDEYRNMDVVRLRSYENGSWTVHLEGVDWFGPWTIAPDGTAWAAYPAEGEGQGLVVARLGADGWEPFDGPLPAEPHDIYVTSSGEVWLVAEGRPWRYREDDGAWQELAVDTTGLEIGYGETTVVADGTVWVAGEELRMADGEPVLDVHGRHAEGDPILMRFDGSEWRRWGPADGVPARSSPEERFIWNDLQQAPDGALWASYATRKPEGWYVGSVERFDVDDSTWHRFLPELDGLDGVVAPDGSVWLTSRRGLYVITPEAVAGVE